MFRARGPSWFVSHGGRTAWQTLQSSGLTLADLSFGDFNGDGRTDPLFVGYVDDLAR